MNSSRNLLVCVLLVILLDCWHLTAKTDSADFAALTRVSGKWEYTPPNWVGRDPCGSEWVGISCNNSRVISILSGTNLTGQLPEEILSLTKLENLDLSNNKGLTGPLPVNIGILKNLITLALIGCNLSGYIPDSIGSLRQLTRLFLNINHFSGPIPNSIGNLKSLVWLDLSNNKLNGAIPVSNRTASGMNQLLNAGHFHLGENKLSGEIPPSLFTSKMSLIHLILNHNKLKGNIPYTLGLVLTLRVIRLDRNRLSGSVPQNISNLKSVRELNLANNHFHGPFPDLTGMNSLAYIDMSNNSFNAPVLPLYFTNLLNLTTLRMERTGIQGPVPTELFNLPMLQTVLLKNNELNGTVDIGTSFSRDLRLIDLRNNSIDEFSFGGYNKTVLLDDNPFCMNPDAEGICKTTEVSKYSHYIPDLYCAPQSCFSDIVLGSNCKHPYLGSLVFRSYYFSDLTKEFYYKFLTETLKPDLIGIGVPVDKVCLVSSLIDTTGDLVMYISIFPPNGVYFNRTGISTAGNIFNVHIFNTPYGPYYFIDVTYGGFQDREQSTGRKYHALVIGSSIAGSVLLLLLICAGAFSYRQWKKTDEAMKLNDPFAYWDKNNIPQLNGIRWFSFEDIKRCTDNFSTRNEIGVGGYGKVYMGKLGSGEVVAVKRAQGSRQGALEFKSEIELLSRVHHKNVVTLVGFCCAQGEQMLIYEYIPNDNLRKILSGRSTFHLDWPNRLKVAVGAARGLSYLHELADPPIIHRDIKSDNILLDTHLNAKVADFGLSKPLSNGQDHINTQVKGTVGYVDPEYYKTWQLTEKSDVYSFGVVMLELITGKLPIEKTDYIVRVVEETLKKKGNIYSLVDPTIAWGNLNGSGKFVNIAMRCVQCLGANRPKMGDVVKKLEEIIDQMDQTYFRFEE